VSGHTRGPWAIGMRYPESQWIDVVSTTDERGLPFVSCKHHDQEANARRIVAAVNGASTLSTEALEAGVVDKLVEALEWAMSELRGKTRYDDPQQAINCFDLADDALTLARGEHA